MLERSDIELLKVMMDSLDKYLKAAGRLSKDAFDEMSEHNGLLWLELTKQKEIIEEILQPKNQEPIHDAVEEVPHAGENGPIKLYDAMVDFLKEQKYIELHWVRVYAVKCSQEGFYDFQIKYFEHKDPLQTGKNYLMFGDATTNYSMSKKDNEIVGDTSQCFEYILNLRDKLGIRQ